MHLRPARSGTSASTRTALRLTGARSPTGRPSSRWPRIRSPSATVAFPITPPPVGVSPTRPPAGVAPLAVVFDGSASRDPDSSDGLDTWSLDFDDGSNRATGTDTPPSAIPHTYGTPGVYRATLTVTDTL